MPTIFTRSRVHAVLFALSAIFVLLWFNGRGLLAAAEEGMVFYNPKNSATLSSSVWVKDGFGYVNPIFTPQFPLMSFLGNISLLSNVQVEILVFLLIIMSGLLGFYYLALELTERPVIAFISSLFYFLNLYTMSQVFARMIFSNMILWAYFPIFLFLWIKSMKERRWFWIPMFLATSLVYSYAFSFVSSSVVLWSSAFLYTTVLLISSKDNLKRMWSIALKGFVVLILWMVTNSWWLYPYLTLLNTTFSQLNATQLNLESLRAVSTTFPITQILQLRQKFYFNSAHNKELPWGLFYESIVAQITSWSVFLFALRGIINNKNKKNWLFLTLTFSVALFISKGTNPPLGELFYKWLFNSLSYASILRNSYEKFGLVFLFPYSIFFAYGVVELVNRAKSNARKYLYSTLVTAFVGIVLVWPMWSGKVFQDYYFVKVPNYYKDLNEYLEDDLGEYRILITPMVPSHGVQYIWGYRGDEPSRYLFSKAPVSRATSLKYSGELYDDLKNAVEIYPSKLSALMEKANIKYVIVNNDVKWQTVDAVSTKRVHESLDSIEEIRFVNQFGNLELYQLQTDSNFSPIEVVGDKSLGLEIRKVSNAKYILEIESAPSEYEIVLKEKYDDRWLASVNDELLSNHYVEYDYANGWKINKKGNYTIKLVFKVWPWD